MKRILLPLVLLALILSGIWYSFYGREVVVKIRSFDSDEAAIAVLTPNASKQDIWSAIAYFEDAMTRTKSQPRSYSYYAAALSMMALHQTSPLDKQASSVRAEAVFTEVSEAYPDQGLSVLFEAISLVNAPGFLKLEDKAYTRLISAWQKIQADATDGKLQPLNTEALVIFKLFLPIFERVFSERNRADLALNEVKKDIDNISMFNNRQ